MSVASRQTVVDLLVLALRDTELHDMGLDALRGVLRSDPRLAVLDGALDLEPVWELLSHQPEFRETAASAAVCFVKSHEARLGIALKLPSALAELTEVDVRRLAEKVKPKREAVDKIFDKRVAEELAMSGAGPPRPKVDTGPQWSPAAPTKRWRIPQRVLGGGAAAVIAVSLLWTGFYVLTHATHSPSFRKIDVGFAPGIPLKDASVWAAEVHATLADPRWLARPSDERKSALTTALAHIRSQYPDVRALILKDESAGVRATAQWMDKGPPVVRLY